MADDSSLDKILDRLPYTDGTFDRATCLDVLEHLPFEDQPKAIAELFRVIRPGGELLVAWRAAPHRLHDSSAPRFSHRFTGSADGLVVLRSGHIGGPRSNF